uniref:Uncharacterized protein n=1 Tax=Eutreptiella gymnastica TaxID=73025 RepID=A0A7S4D2I2_9EUGL|mmetsp:Transcript_25461/g.40396  ORF Transcript_25461/g.40396 Transcript_25461/m.40396 type:complete len:109 (+) Transcript_25461:298-624(+)
MQHTTHRQTRRDRNITGIRTGSPRVPRGAGFGNSKGGVPPSPPAPDDDQKYDYEYEYVQYQPATTPLAVSTATAHFSNPKPGLAVQHSATAVYISSSGCTPPTHTPNY